MYVKTQTACMIKTSIHILYVCLKTLYVIICFTKNLYKTVGNSHAPSRTQVHGVWNPWVEWSDCTVNCGGGNRTRGRSCEEPQHGGDPCEGPTSQLEFYGDAPCPGMRIEACKRSFGKGMLSQVCVCSIGVNG